MITQGGEPGVVRGHLKKGNLTASDGHFADDRTVERRAGVTIVLTDNLLRPVVPEDAVEGDDTSAPRLAGPSFAFGAVDGAALTALSALGDGLVSKEGAVEEERVAARAVEERAAVLRLVAREGAVGEHRAGDAVVDRPSRPLVGISNVRVSMSPVPGEGTGADRHTPVPAADVRVIDGAALDHRGVVREETVLDQDVSRGGEAGRAAVVGRSIPLEDGATHRHVRTGVLNIEPSASSACSVVDEAASLDEQSSSAPLLVAELDRAPIARLARRLIRAGSIALKTAIDEPEVALNAVDSSSVAVRAAPVPQKTAGANIQRGRCRVNAAPKGAGAISLEQTILNHNIASAKAQSGAHCLIATRNGQAVQPNPLHVRALQDVLAVRPPDHIGAEGDARRIRCVIPPQVAGQHDAMLIGVTLFPRRLAPRKTAVEGHAVRELEGLPLLRGCDRVR